MNAIEVFSGLDAVVHHADISYDNTGASLANDMLDPLPGFNSNTGSPTYSFYMNAWQPGGNVVRYPPQWGIAVPPNADFVIEIHYGPGAQGQVDSTVMNLEFVNGGGVRPVSVGWLLNTSHMTDGPLEIPANTVQTFHQERTVTATTSFVSICPHMHHVGVSYKVWFEYAGDTVPLIDIPQWDFHWQRYYTFQQVQVIPAGAVIKSEAVYDNTIFNPDNPHNPPQDMYNGSTTDSEMFLCYFIWANYQAGDEDIVMDSTLLVNTPEQIPSDDGLTIFPNPTNGMVHIAMPPDLTGSSQLRVMDAAGRVVLSSAPRMASNELVLHEDLSGLPQGVYLLEMRNDTKRWMQRVVRW
ncbi:MAG: T9SS type A sorting domain-containing protein [Flavobacteriales bacterium]|nr:T9SS type A sorting domain-containing protein [Flavobacteriales bacterium]